MQNVDPHMNIARKVRSVDAARTEMIGQVAEVFRSIQSGHQRDMTRSLAALIGLSYYLGEQMGIHPEQIDAEVLDSLYSCLPERQVDQANLDVVSRYVTAKRC